MKIGTLALFGRILRLAAVLRQRHGDHLAIALMSACILGLAYEYVDPRQPGIPVGIDLGDDLAYLGTLRSELLDSGRLMTWWGVAYDGIPLMGHPITQFFYPPLVIPSIVLGTTGGVRVAYIFSLLLAGGGMYTLVRILGPRPMLAAWAGLLFAMGGGIGARIHAGHLEKVLAMPFVPLVLACALLVGRSRSWRVAVFWAATSGLLHGVTFLAGDAYIPLFLLFAVPIIFAAAAGRGDDGGLRRGRLPLVLGSWAAALLVATSGKLIAATSILAETTRSVNPYFGSQDSHWFIVHLAFPFFSAVPGLPNFSYGPGQAGWGWGWWEYTQYIGFLPVVLALLVVGAILFELVRRKVLVSHGLRHREIAALLGVVLLAVLWLANAQWYSPVHWLFEAVPPLQRFRVPSRSLVLVAPVFLALAAIALEESLRWRPGRFSVIAACLAFTGLVGAWWVNTSWFNPVQWFCNGIPGLNGAPTPVCLAVLAAIGLLSLMAFAYWARRLTAQGRYRVVVTGLALAAVLALGDVFHATRANLQVREGPSADRIRRVAEELKLRDPGPILVGLGATGKKYFGNTGMYVNKSVKFELVDRGIAVAEDVSPLWPKQQSQHRVIGLDKRLRYRIAPSEPEPVIEKGWSRLMQDGDVVVLVNDQADGDAWLVSSGRSSPQISPLKVSDWAPGRFTVSAYAPVDAIVAVPANAFRGWHVSVDGGPLQQAIEFDGYVASDAYSGQHTYRFVYKAPYLPAILVLGALPWILALGLGVLGAVVWLRRNTGAAESI